MPTSFSTTSSHTVCHWPEPNENWPRPSEVPKSELQIVLLWEHRPETAGM